MEITDDTPTEQLPTLPPGETTWDDVAGEWLVGGRPTPPGVYQRDGERHRLVDPADPASYVI